MPSFGQVYGEITGMLNEHDAVYNPGDVKEGFGKLSDEELEELYDNLLDEDWTYDEFCDWCEDHGVKYH